MCSTCSGTGIIPCEPADSRNELDAEQQIDKEGRMEGGWIVHWKEW